MRFQLLMLLLAVTCIGCGRSDVVPVSGTVVRGGQPVPNVVVWFTPAEGRPSWALTDSNGHFELEYNREHKGAKVGKHVVTVKYDARPADPVEEQLILTGKKARPVRPPGMDEILAKYGPGVSQLQIDVSRAVKDLEVKVD
ncbi:Ig-like domain-containing protein [Anatilimnocola floriformis]|uniref:Ig-like domain-containing protein n=1 Tax=Anatilimnocola floriformis TaxID=2948575 RepID=UPI0020C3C517|nr:Ig-like domain-containing protein [Anatilimnocola floriformis]